MISCAIVSAATIPPPYIPLLGERGIFVTSFEEHRKLRKVSLPFQSDDRRYLRWSRRGGSPETSPASRQTLSVAFTAAAIKGYLPAMQRLAEDAVSKWAQASGQITGVDAVRKEIQSRSGAFANGPSDDALSGRPTSLMASPTTWPSSGEGLQLLGDAGGGHGLRQAALDGRLSSGANPGPLEDSELGHVRPPHQDPGLR